MKEVERAGSGRSLSLSASLTTEDSRRRPETCSGDGHITAKFKIESRDPQVLISTQQFRE